MKITKILITPLALLLLAGPVWAASATQDVIIKATVSARATLSFTGLGAGNSINFADADPGTITSIGANENGAATCICKVRTGSTSNPTLTCKAADDLKNADTGVIPISKVTWTAASPFINGTMGKTDQTVSATWTSSGIYQGPLNYYLNNSSPDAWGWPTGSYSATVTYTLTAP